MAVNHLEVHKISVQPLALWNALYRSQQPRITKWPCSSNLLCWHCCHGFDNIPAFMPVDFDKKKGVFVFTGNFCSWNCVKQYAFDMQKRNIAPKGSCYIGLLTFLTSYRSTMCSTPTLHEAGLCHCVEEFQPVAPAPPKECLDSFGGSMTIQEYRSSFLFIQDYEWVEERFHRTMVLEQVMDRARRLPRQPRKAWGFTHITYPGPPGSVVECVRILPLSNRVLQQQSVDDEPPKKKRATKKRTATTAEPVPMPEEENNNKESNLLGMIQPRPSRTKIQVAHGISRVDQQRQRGPSNILTNEQLLSVNEEQAYYTRNLRQYGNLVDAMGISIKRRPDEVS